MLLVDEARFPRFNLSKLDEAYRLAEVIINDLNPEAVNEVLQAVGSEKDMDIFFDAILEESYASLFSSHKTKDYGSTSLTYMDKVSEGLEETLRCENFAYFTSSVLKDSFDIAWFHLEWFEIIQKFRYNLVEAARGHGKSYLFSNALPAWYMYKFKPKNNSPLEQSKRKIMLFSFSIAQAIDLLAILRETIESSDILKDRLYDKNNFSKMELTAKNKTNIKVKGFGGSVRGAHPYYIIVDDGLKDNVMYSADARDKSINYFHSVVMNLLEPSGSINVVGTPFHQSDLYGDLKMKKGWHCWEYPAIFPDGRILWPERWSYASLMDKKETQGSLIFSRELLCRPVMSSSTIFPIEILNNAFLRMENYVLVTARENYPIKFAKVVCGCDFAISSSIGADSSCFTVWGVTDDDKMYLLYFYSEKGKTFTEQIAQISWINRMFKPDLILMEDNNFQTMFVETSKKQGLPVKGFTTTSKKNSLRLGWPSLAILFENGRIKIPIGDDKSKNVADMFITQFSGVAFTAKGLQNTQNHDDICSSTFLAYNAVKELQGKAFDFAFV